MKENQIKVLLVEDEEFDVNRTTNTIKPYEEKIKIIDVVSTGNQAINLIKENQYDVVLLDYQISGGLYGEELIKRIKEINKSIQIIVITKMTLNQTDLILANQILNSGAFWFGTKNPTDIEEAIYQPTDFILAIVNAFEKKQLEEEKNKLLNEKKDSQEKLDKKIQTIIDEKPFIGNSAILMKVKDQIKTYSQTNTSVLITGESGTGKELVARNIHYYSKRKYEKMITLNCSAIPEHLIESELFGYEKGAFTDAKSSKLGLFEQAHKGTIFLDEISELPLNSQAKLLRVLETGEIDKIGRNKIYVADVRVISATNKNLLELVRKKMFREDLYYRLNILNIYIPPLRERKEDISNLIHFYTNFYCNDLSIKIPTYKPESIKYLQKYDWPGNVRELKNVIQRIIVRKNDIIDLETVKVSIDGKNKGEFSLFTLDNIDENNFIKLKDAERKFKINYCNYARKISKNDTEAALKLGLPPSNFHRLCKDLGIK